ncbi:MAG: hypothetical protein AAFZ01_08735 [Pseudomonadota bacterium]
MYTSPRIGARAAALALAGVLAVGSTAALAGKLERGNRNVSPIFADGKIYGEISGAFILPDGDGQDSFGRDFGDFLQRDTDFGAAVKYQISPTLSTALIFDEPFGANIAYDEAAFPIGPGPLPGVSVNGTFADLTVLSFTSITRYKFNENFSVYGGPRAQRAGFEVGLPFLAATGLLNYQANSGDDWGFGYVAGAAFEIPQFKVRASLTYHSEIQHEWNIRETGTTALGAFSNVGRFANQTPQGVDFDFQFPVSKTTLVYGNIHWADFSATSLVVPSLPTAPILEYNGDNWAAKLGVAQALSPTWVVAADVTYEWESGEDTSPFRTADGEVSLGLASRHQFEGTTVTFGAQYKVLDANDPNPAFLPGVPPVGISYGDQDVLSLGVKIGFSLSEDTPSTSLK